MRKFIAAFLCCLSLSPVPEAARASTAPPSMTEAPPPYQFREMLRRERKLGCADEMCLPREWRLELERWRGASLADKAYAVNALVNRMPYARDRVAWGSKDYWATPMEFHERGVGDCDDFAVAKRQALRWLGVPSDRLLMAIVETDRGLHAVLVVRLAEGNFVLDIGSDEFRLLDHKDYRSTVMIATEHTAVWDSRWKKYGPGGQDR